MRYRAYTVNVEEGELFPSLMEALSYIYEEIEIAPLIHFKKEVETDGFHWTEFTFKIKDLATDKVIWEESHE